MGRAHEPETVWRAQELYCSDRLTFEGVAAATGVAVSTLCRWADRYGWRAKREELARAESEIRADKVLARSKTLKALLNKPDAQNAFAVSALETLALKEAEAARQGQALPDAAAGELPAIRTRADAVAAVRTAVERRLHMLLARPESVDLRALQEVQRCLALIGDMERAVPSDAAAPSGQKGITAEMYETLVAVLSGEVDV